EKRDEAAQASAFLSDLYRLVEQGQQRAAMQALYSYLYDLRMRGEDGVSGRILEDMDIGRLPPALLVAVLTVTRPLKDPLREKRSSFYERTRAAITTLRGSEAAERILVGLE